MILFFDELPWLATPRSDLIRSLEYIWNHYFSKCPHIIMVLCGSAASWILKNIIHNRGGLYGRLTQKIHLQPFSLLETEHYLKEKSVMLDRKQLIEVYMLTGGIAKYLNHVERGLSSMQIIKSLCFSPHGFLKTEFLSLFASLFEESDLHRAIVKMLAKRHKGLTLQTLSKLLSRTPGGRLTSALNDLIDSGFIQIIPFYGRKKRESLYRLVDEYSLFYLTWIEGSDKLLHFQNSQKFATWSGYAFENICIKHIKQIVESLGLTVVFKGMSYFEKKKDERPGIQIDLLIDRTDRCMNLLEMKFSTARFTITPSYSQLLNKRRSIFSEVTSVKKTLFNTIITPFGCMKNPHYLASIDQEASLDALFTF